MEFFGTSGIRGLTNVEIDPSLATKIGMAIGSIISPGESVLVGMDSRKGANMIKNALISGLLSVGINVIDCDLSPTPLVGYGIKELGCALGVVVTASHNPPEYIGIKILDRDSAPLSEEKQSKIEEILLANSFRKVSWLEVGKLKHINSYELIEKYLNSAKGYVRGTSPLKIVIDPGGGVTGPLSISLYEDLGFNVIDIHSLPRGRFPRKLAPISENLKLLRDVVKASDADLGIAYDGDGDRVGVYVRDQDLWLTQEIGICLLSKYVCGRPDLSKNRRRTIVTTVDAGFEIDEFLYRTTKVQKVIRVPVGDPAVSNKVKEEGALMGGEPSGTYVIPSWNLTPDGIFSSLLFADCYDKSKELLEDLSPIPSYPKIRKNIRCSKENKHQIFQKIYREIIDIISREQGDFEILEVDGVRIESTDYFILIRPSGTEPCIRITIEAKDRKKLEYLDKIINRIQEKIRNTSK